MRTNGVPSTTIANLPSNRFPATTSGRSVWYKVGNVVNVSSSISRSIYPDSKILSISIFSGASALLSAPFHHKCHECTWARHPCVSQIRFSFSLPIHSDFWCIGGSWKYWFAETLWTLGADRGRTPGCSALGWSVSLPLCLANKRLFWTVCENQWIAEH